MRVQLTAMNCPKGDLPGNTRAHIDQIKAAASAGCDLAVFPEMSLTGYIHPGDPAQPAVTLDDAAVQLVTAATARFNMAAVIGIAELNPGGPKPFITQIALERGKIVGRYRKFNVADDEKAFFEADQTCACFDFRPGRVGIAICADMDVPEPWDFAARHGARVILHCAAPGLYAPRRGDTASWQRGYQWWREHALAIDGAHAVRSGLPVAISTQAGATVDEDFPGWCGLMNAQGALVAERDTWHPGALVVEIAT